MKKVAITTAVSICNYGTKLQALAMCEIFKKRGFVPLVLEFSEGKDITFLLKIKQKLGRFIRIILKGKDYQFKNKFAQEYHNVNFIRENIISRYHAVDSDDYLIPHYRFLGSKKSLIEYAKQFSLAVCGSDQVWHPVLNKKNLWFFTLNFAPKSAMRIAYAPSLGVDDLTEEQEKEFSSLISGLDFVSLREISGVNAIKKITDKPVSLVLDPTLLVGRGLWDKVLNENKVPQKEKYCLCYLLGTNPQHREICEIVSKKLGVKLLNFAHFKAYNDSDEKLSGDKLYDVTPSEFIGLIKNAKFVITDSFHCSVFSMMYHVPFMTLLRFQKADKLSTNTRIFSMLQQFGLGNRLLDNGQKVDTILSSSIDFDAVENILISKRKESNSYLGKALQNEKINV